MCVMCERVHGMFFHVADYFYAFICMDVCACVCVCAYVCVCACVHQILLFCGNLVLLGEYAFLPKMPLRYVCVCVCV